jgi:hypothetical protein
MTTFLVFTALFFLIFLTLMGIGKRQEIMGNWTRYKGHPLYMATAFLYKPDDDPRSRFEFMNDNFRKQLQSLVAQTFKVVMAPLFDVFQVTGGGVVGSMQGTRAIQNIIATMMSSFGQIFSIFERRYESTLFRLTMTFRKLQTSMDRIWGTATAAIYKGMALTQSILSTMDLIMKIVIIILCIMIGIVMFLFLFLWPMIPVILTVIGVLVTAGMGAAVGGMADTFCFMGDTPVQMADGTRKPIREIVLGEELLGCGKVTGCMEFLQSAELYELAGVHVTGTHIVYHKNQPIHVKDHPDATRIPTTEHHPIQLICLNTESHRIPVVGSHGLMEFADWEEIGDTDQAAWNRFVWETLNPGIAWNATDAVLEGEAGFPTMTLVQTPTGPIAISELRPGMEVLNHFGTPTRVLGVVEVADGNPAAIWRLSDGIWKQNAGLQMKRGICRHLVTKAGTFLVGETPVRDFTDVEDLSQSYSWVLEALGHSD